LEFNRDFNRALEIQQAFQWGFSKVFKLTRGHPQGAGGAAALGPAVAAAALRDLHLLLVRFELFRIVLNCFELFRIVSNCFELFRIVSNCFELF
jgi:hypothetical protein